MDAMTLTIAVTLLIGLLGGGGIVGLVSLYVSSRQAEAQRKHDSAEREKERAHDLNVRAQDHDYQLKLRGLEDQQRLRDERHARLRDDLAELVETTFLMQQVVLLALWGGDTEQARMQEFADSAHRRFDNARARLALDQAGSELSLDVADLSRDVDQFLLTLPPRSKKQANQLHDRVDAIAAKARTVLDSIVQPLP
jgi:hypothetical protein